MTHAPPDRRTGPLDQATVGQVRALAAEAAHADGVEALGEQTLLDLGQDRTHLLVREGGETVGYAQADTRGTRGRVGAEMVVHPRWRGRGHGGRLLTGLLETAGARGLAVWAHGNLPAARALAGRHAMTPARELWRMARDLDVDAPSTRPQVEGTLRSFVPGQDEPAWVAVNARAFDWHPEQGRMTAADLRARQAEPWFDPEDLILAERDGTLVAFAWCKLEPGTVEGELYALGVDPTAQGTGLGRALTHVVLAHLAARGRTRAVLFTEATNTAAVRTYRSVGFTTDRVDVQHTTDG